MKPITLTKKVRFNYHPSNTTPKVMNPITAAEDGNLEYIKKMAFDDLKITNENGESLLSIAARFRHFDCCKEIFRRCPLLLYHQNNFGSTILHGCTKPDLVKLILDAEGEIKKGGVSDKNLLTMKNNKGNTALHSAVAGFSVEVVRILIEADPLYEYGLNDEDENPLLIALRETGESSSDEKANICKLLVEKLPHQAKAVTGDKQWTALHRATYNSGRGSYYTKSMYVEGIIRGCPDCCPLVDHRGRNFIHLAAKYENLQIIKSVLGMKEISDSILNAQDNDGNTPLHTAALADCEKLTLYLLYDPRVSTTIRNAKGQTVLDIIDFEYDKLKAGVFGTRGMSTTEMKEQSDFDLVVGALIAAVSFTAGITIPGGYISDC